MVRGKRELKENMRRNKNNQIHLMPILLSAYYHLSIQREVVGGVVTSAKKQEATEQAIAFTKQKEKDDNVEQQQNNEGHHNDSHDNAQSRDKNLPMMMDSPMKEPHQQDRDQQVDLTLLRVGQAIFDEICSLAQEQAAPSVLRNKNKNTQVTRTTTKKKWSSFHDHDDYEEDEEEDEEEDDGSSSFSKNKNTGQHVKSKSTSTAGSLLSSSNSLSSTTHLHGKRQEQKRIQGNDEKTCPCCPSSSGETANNNKKKASHDYHDSTERADKKGRIEKQEVSSVDPCNYQRPPLLAPLLMKYLEVYEHKLLLPILFLVCMHPLLDPCLSNHGDALDNKRQKEGKLPREELQELDQHMHSNDSNDDSKRSYISNSNLIDNEQIIATNMYVSSSATTMNIHTSYGNFSSSPRIEEQEGEEQFVVPNDTNNDDITSDASKTEDPEAAGISQYDTKSNTIQERLQHHHDDGDRCESEDASNMIWCFPTEVEEQGRCLQQDNEMTRLLLIERDLENVSNENLLSYLCSMLEKPKNYKSNGFRSHIEMVAFILIAVFTNMQLVEPNQYVLNVITKLYPRALLCTGDEEKTETVHLTGQGPSSINLGTMMPGANSSDNLFGSLQDQRPRPTLHEYYNYDKHLLITRSGEEEEKQQHAAEVQDIRKNNNNNVTQSQKKGKSSYSSSNDDEHVLIRRRNAFFFLNSSNISSLSYPSDACHNNIRMKISPKDIELSPINFLCNHSKNAYLIYTILQNLYCYEQCNHVQPSSKKHANFHWSESKETLTHQRNEYVPKREQSSNEDMRMRNSSFKNKKHKQNMTTTKPKTISLLQLLINDRNSIDIPLVTSNVLNILILRKDTSICSQVLKLLLKTQVSQDHHVEEIIDRTSYKMQEQHQKLNTDLFYLFEIVATRGHPETLRLLLEMEPHIIMTKNYDTYYMPLQNTVLDFRYEGNKINYISPDKYASRIGFLLCEGISYAIEQGISPYLLGGLFAVDSEIDSFLIEIKFLLGEDICWQLLKTCLANFAPYAKVPILHAAIGKVHVQTLVDIMQHFETSPFSCDEEGNYALHIAVLKGVQWSLGLSAILYANPLAALEAEVTSGLPPLAVAALQKNHGLETLYQLSLVAIGEGYLNDLFVS